jgi:hypothetical protein
MEAFLIALAFASLPEFIMLANSMMTETLFIPVLYLALLFSAKFAGDHYKGNYGWSAMSRLSAIPQKAIVSAGPNIYPHLFRHASIYSFPYIGSAHPAEYIVIDTSNLLPGSQAVLGDILASGKYRKDWQNGKYEIIIRQSSHGKQDSEGAL